MNPHQENFGNVSSLMQFVPTSSIIFRSDTISDVWECTCVGCMCAQVDKFIRVIKLQQCPPLRTKQVVSPWSKSCIVFWDWWLFAINLLIFWATQQANLSSLHINEETFCFIGIGRQNNVFTLPIAPTNSCNPQRCGREVDGMPKNK